MKGIAKEKYLNLAVKTFDDAEKYIDVEPTSEVVKQAVAALNAIKASTIEFSMENHKALMELYSAVTSDRGSKMNYRMQNIEFAKASFDEYIGKVLEVPSAAMNGTLTDGVTIDAGFFMRDCNFIIALFSTEENECVPIPAEEAFEEIKLQLLAQIVDDFSKHIMDKASMIPTSPEPVDGATAAKLDICRMAIKLMATSMVRFTALLFRHVVNNAVYLYNYAMDDRARWSREEAPSICWKEDDEIPEPDESQRWAVFM